MPNVLDQRINVNEELYGSTKKELEERICIANGEYNALLNDFNSQIKYIQKDNMLSKDGKVKKANEIRENFINKASVKSLDYYDTLQKSLDIAIKKGEIRRLENFKGLNSEMMPQLLYVNSMINSISSLNDADLLEDVFNYASEEGNFSDELINMVYIKARNLINNSTLSQNMENDNDNVLKVAELGKSRAKISDIIVKITKYKKDYTKEFNDFKTSFARAFNQKKYPTNLYIQRDPKSDFIVPGNLQDNDWNKPGSNNAPWAR